MISVGIIEDNADFVEDLVFQLQHANIATSYQSNGENVDIDEILTSCDVILVDLGLPNIDGTEIINAIRKKSAQIGIIVVSARSNIADKFASVTNGTDIYLVKPIDTAEIILNINALYRRVDTTNKNQSTASIPWQLDTSALRLITPNQSQIRVTHTEATLIGALIDNSPNRVSLDMLACAIGADQNFDVYHRRIQVALGRLRKKISAVNPEYSIIKSSGNQSYVFGDKAKKIS
jgi:DNA-binding response OmpR family regulator